MPLGIGVVGLASFYSGYYANRAAERPDCEVVAAARLDATDDELRALGRRTAGGFSDAHDCPVYDSADELLDDDAVDAAVVSSRTTRRADDAVAALETGRPVLTGKPAAATPDGAARIAAAARDAGLPAVTTTPHRHDGRIEEAARRVAGGELGDVLRVRTSVYHGRVGEAGIEANDGHAPGEAGTAYTMGFYTADALLWIAGGTPERVTGELENANTPYQEHPDLGSATVRFDDGTLGTMTITMANDHGPGYGWDVEVVGTEGTLRTHHGGHEGIQWGDGGTDVFGRTLDPVLDHQFDAFAAAVRERGGPDAVAPGPEFARDGIALCAAWEDAAGTGGAARY